MNKALFCMACGAQLSRSFVLRSGKDPSVTKPEFVDREPLTPAGEVYKSHEPIRRSYAEVPDPLEFVPQLWINPSDLTDAVRDTKKRGRFGGCCGESGSSGPNQSCRCGEDVGTFMDDCFTSKVFIPDPSATELRPIENT